MPDGRIPVVLATYNRVNAMPDIVRAAFADDGVHEVLIADDASTDQTRVAAAIWCSATPRVRLHLTESNGDRPGRAPSASTWPRRGSSLHDDDVLLQPEAAAGPLAHHRAGWDVVVGP